MIARAADLRPPCDGDVSDQRYLVDDANGEPVWMRGDELVSVAGVVRVRAIAWRL